MRACVPRAIDSTPESPAAMRHPHKPPAQSATTSRQSKHNLQAVSPKPAQSSNPPSSPANSPIASLRDFPQGCSSPIHDLQPPRAIAAQISLATSPNTPPRSPAPPHHSNPQMLNRMNNLHSPRVDPPLPRVPKTGPADNCARMDHVAK